MHNILPKKFCFINKLEKNYIRKFNRNIGIIYRNYKELDIDKKLLEFHNLCKKNKIKFYLANNIKLAVKLKLDGAYIPSFNNSMFKEKLLRNNFHLIGSAHNIKKIRIKEQQGVSLIFLSPIFKTKKTNKILGINRFNILSSYTKNKIVALGGINANNIRKLNMTKAYGFAGISFFKENLKI